jgi:hypothetical protein
MEDNMRGAKRWKLSGALILTLVLLSCVTITLTDIGHLRKGMTREEAKATLPLPPRSEFPLAAGDGAAQIEVCTYIVSSGNYDSDYYLAFDSDKLLFWGYPHEFARSTSSLINEIGEKAVAAQTSLDQESKQQRARPKSGY